MPACGQEDMTKPTVAVRSFSKAPKSVMDKECWSHAQLSRTCKDNQWPIKDYGRIQVSSVSSDSLLLNQKSTVGVTRTLPALIHLCCVYDLPSQPSTVVAPVLSLVHCGHGQRWTGRVGHITEHTYSESEATDITSRVGHS